MSVINQMLKDLEERSPANGQTQSQSIAPPPKNTVKIILITMIVLLGLNGLGFYIWHLQERVVESEAKSQKIAEHLTKESAVNDQTVKGHGQDKQSVQATDVAQPDPVQASATLAIEQQSITEQQPKSQSLPKSLSAHSAEVSTSRSKGEALIKRINLAPNNNVDQIKKELNKSIQKTTPILVDNETSPMKSAPIESIASKGKITVSRRQLTPSELVEQTLIKAEKAIANNDIAKAEQLFEEILIIDPNQKQARKKLAALWFGRQSYQQAVNLLSQGIAIDQLDSEMRLMKAQIQVKQGQPEAAFNTLKPLNSLEQEEYQVMLANLAQQVEQFPSAIMAYQVLIKMQPYSGRWYLGLAIVYDKNSQFPLAVNAYTLALSKADLSASSAKFAKQRMQVLGE